MLDKEFAIALDDQITRIAALAVLMGSMLIRLAHWTTLGWAIAVLGLLALWLAHQLAVAPECDESARWTGPA